MENKRIGNDLKLGMRSKKIKHIFASGPFKHFYFIIVTVALAKT